MREGPQKKSVTELKSGYLKCGWIKELHKKNYIIMDLEIILSMNNCSFGLIFWSDLTVMNSPVRGQCPFSNCHTEHQTNTKRQVDKNITPPTVKARMGKTIFLR